MVNDLPVPRRDPITQTRLRGGHRSLVDAQIDFYGQVINWGSDISAVGSWHENSVSWTELTYDVEEFSSIPWLSRHDVMSKALIGGDIHDLVNNICFGWMLFNQPTQRTLPRRDSHGKNEALWRRCRVRFGMLACKLLQREDCSTRLGSNLQFGIYIGQPSSKVSSSCKVIGSYLVLSVLLAPMCHRRSCNRTIAHGIAVLLCWITDVVDLCR